MGTMSLPLDVLSARLKTTNTPELVAIAGTNFPVGGIAFDAAAREDIYLQFPVPLLGAAATSITVNLVWYSRSGSITGDVVWGAAFSRYVSGTSSEALAFLTASTTTNTVVGTAKGKSSVSFAVTTITGIVANDFVELDVYRDGASGSDTMAGDAILVGLYLSYSDV